MCAPEVPMEFLAALTRRCMSPCHAPMRPVCRSHLVVNLIHVTMSSLARQCVVKKKKNERRVL